MPGYSGGPVVTMLVCSFILHARLRVQRAPGIPHALQGGRIFFVSTRASCAAGTRAHILTLLRAIHFCRLRPPWIASLALAMTYLSVIAGHDGSTNRSHAGREDRRFPLSFWPVSLWNYGNAIRIFR